MDIMPQLCAALIVVLALVATRSALAQSTGLKSSSKCPIQNLKPYDDVIKYDELNREWFTAPTTTALRQAAYAFDTNRVKCLLSEDKISLSTKVPVGGGLNPVQYALNDAVSHIMDLYSKYKVTSDMTATVQALLDAGAIGGSPDVKLYSKLLVDVTGRADSCTELDPYDACFTAPGLLTIAKALVAAGANIEGVPDQQYLTPLGLLVSGMTPGSHCTDPVYKQFLEFFISKGANASAALREGPAVSACPAFYQLVKKAADAQSNG